MAVMRLTAAALFALLAAPAVPAQIVVVSFGGDYGNANQPFQPAVETGTGQFFGGSGGNDSRSIVPFSTTTPQVVAGGTSGTFYGGYESVNYGQFGTAPPPPPDFTSRQVTDGGATDWIELGTGPRHFSANAGRFAGLLLWQKEDFLNGGSGTTLITDANSKITVQRAPGSGTIYRMTVIVRDGDTIYANQSQFNNSSTNFTQFLHNQSWAVYDPTTRLEFNGPFNSATFAPHTFTNITGVGFLWNLNGFSSLNAFPNTFRVSGFSATLATAPLQCPAGDCNGDQFVDAADYVIWRKSNLDGPQGYDSWRANFGNSSGAGAGERIQGTVPEPATVLLLLIAMYCRMSCLGRVSRRSRDDVVHLIDYRQRFLSRTKEPA